MPKHQLDSVDQWAAEMPDDPAEIVRWAAAMPRSLLAVEQRSTSADALVHKQQVTSPMTDYQRHLARQHEQDQRVAGQVADAIEAYHRGMIEAHGEVISHERAAMREHVASEIQKLRDEIATLRAELDGKVKMLPTKRDIA
jgi:hypothetical protein